MQFAVPDETLVIRLSHMRRETPDVMAIGRIRSGLLQHRLVTRRLYRRRLDVVGRNRPRQPAPVVKPAHVGSAPFSDLPRQRRHAAWPPRHPHRAGSGPSCRRNRPAASGRESGSAALTPRRERHFRNRRHQVAHAKGAQSRFTARHNRHPSVIGRPCRNRSASMYVNGPAGEGRSAREAPASVHPRNATRCCTGASSPLRSSRCVSGSAHRSRCRPERGSHASPPRG